MSEPDSNIIKVCPECAKRIHYKGDVQFLVGKFVKLSFHTDDGSGINEHMWVKVILADPDTKVMSGSLANEPRHCQYIKYGDRVTDIYPSDIEDVYTGGD